MDLKIKKHKYFDRKQGEFKIVNNRIIHKNIENSFKGYLGLILKNVSYLIPHFRNHQVLVAEKIENINSMNRIKPTTSKEEWMKLRLKLLDTDFIMKVVILAGGRGTRISEYTKTIPKPMIKINKKPILIHIMKIYIKFGFTEFIIASGYKKLSKNILKVLKNGVEFNQLLFKKIM